MKQETKKKLIILISIFIVLGIITIFISLLTKKSSTSKIKLLSDEEKYFSIKSTVNTNINNDNINYIITKILYKTYNNTDYCFINGYTLEYQEFGDVLYKDNVNFLMILKGNTYNIYTITTTDIEEYANKYNTYTELKDGKILDMINHSEKNKLSSYISNFINLVNYNTKESYNYLKNKNDNIDKYKKLSSNIISYNKNGNTYIITDSNNNTFKIIEDSVMNYKIEL